MGHWDAVSIDHGSVFVESSNRAISRELLLTRLSRSVDKSRLPFALASLTDYCGAASYLLARYDMSSEQRLDGIVSSNWPFDLVRRIEPEIQAAYHRSSELEKCLNILQASFELLPDDAVVPEGFSRQYCSILLNAGRSRFILLFLIPEHMVISSLKMMEAGLLVSYLLSMQTETDAHPDRDMELTERELECLYWIAEGKTSDEIAVILGISRNTINNYITSVMRKTATKNRSEAIAYAVRNNLV
jgi:DNA-binding CsgD family transcriptional regulator